MNRSQLFLLPFLAASCGHLVCLDAESDYQPLPTVQAVQALSDVQAVDNGKMVVALAKVERALRSVQKHAARDEILKPLAKVKIQQGRYPGTNGGWIRVDAQIHDYIDVPTKGAPVKIAGRIDVDVMYTALPQDYEPSGGPFHGRVMWKTDNPNVYVTLGWMTRDLKAPERLLTIVREGLHNQGIRMLAAPKSDWPTATLPEYLAHLPAPGITKSLTGEPGPRARQPLDQRPPPTSPRSYLGR